MQTIRYGISLFLILPWLGPGNVSASDIRIEVQNPQTGETRVYEKTYTEQEKERILQRQKAIEDSRQKEGQNRESQARENQVKEQQERRAMETERNERLEAERERMLELRNDCYNANNSRYLIDCLNRTNQELNRLNQEQLYEPPADY